MVIVLGNLIALGVLLVAAELLARGIVWLWGVPTAFQPRPFQGFGRTDPVLWWRLRPNLDDWMGQVRLKTNRLGFRDSRDSLPKGSTKVYSLGDSTTFGWGVPASAMFTAVAEEALNEGSKRRVAIVSAGVPGYTSYQCLEQFREDIAPLRPDWIVVMASNNECRSRFLGDRERGANLARKKTLDGLLGFSRIWLLLSRTPESLTREWELDPPSGRVANTEDEYRHNLGTLIREARASGCRVIVMNMPLRLRKEPDWKHFDRTSPKVAALLDRADVARRSNAPLSDQEAPLAEAIRLQPDQFAAHWRLAQVEQASGRDDEASRQFALAREGDLHPDAAKPSYNAALKSLCDGENVPFLDIDRAFRESGKADDELFLDHCHPSPAGQRIIGRELARKLGDLLPSR